VTDDSGGMKRPIPLAPTVWAALDQISRMERVPVSDLVRDAVQRELYRRQRSAKADRPDEAALAPLRALLADDFAYATGWDDLTRRLLHKGYRLAESGPGLILVAQETNDRICKASELGYSHAKLAGRLGGAFPAHAHGHVVGRVQPVHQAVNGFLHGRTRGKPFTA
jgi:hypothetical protein